VKGMTKGMQHIRNR